VQINDDDDDEHAVTENERPGCETDNKKDLSSSTSTTVVSRINSGTPGWQSCTVINSSNE